MSMAKKKLKVHEIKLHNKSGELESSQDYQSILYSFDYIEIMTWHRASPEKMLHLVLWCWLYLTFYTVE